LRDLAFENSYPHMIFIWPRVNKLILPIAREKKRGQIFVSATDTNCGWYWGLSSYSWIL
jgi:hypothetical protein